MRNQAKAPILTPGLNHALDADFMRQNQQDESEQKSPLPKERGTFHIFEKSSHDLHLTE